MADQTPDETAEQTFAVDTLTAAVESLDEQIAATERWGENPTLTAASRRAALDALRQIDKRAAKLRAIYGAVTVVPEPEREGRAVDAVRALMADPKFTWRNIVLNPFGPAPEYSGHASADDGGSWGVEVSATEQGAVVAARGSYRIGQLFADLIPLSQESTGTIHVDYCEDFEARLRFAVMRALDAVEDALFASPAAKAGA